MKGFLTDITYNINYKGTNSKTVSRLADVGSNPAGGACVLP